MNASVARQTTNEARVVDMKPIFERIKHTAGLGGEAIQVRLQDSHYEMFADEIIKNLKNLNYKVKREKGYDQRDYLSWDYLDVSW